MITLGLLACVVAALFSSTIDAATGSPPRARALGVPFEGAPGPNNAITDVQLTALYPGVTVEAARESGANFFAGCEPA
jgi:hypothetical protein